MLIFVKRASFWYDVSERSGAEGRVKRLNPRQRPCMHEQPLTQQGQITRSLLKMNCGVQTYQPLKHPPTTTSLLFLSTSLEHVHMDSNTSSDHSRNVPSDLTQCTQLFAHRPRSGLGTFPLDVLLLILDAVGELKYEFGEPERGTLHACALTCHSMLRPSQA